IGAVAEEYQPIYSDDIEIEDIDQNWLNDAVKSARSLIDKRRQNYYGKDFQPPGVMGKIVIIVDDGIATGLTMQASIDAVRRQKPQQIILAVPVASYQSLDNLEKLVDKVIVLDNPLNFLGAVGAHYVSFEQVSDDQVRKLLRESYHAKNQA
ncbi:MAG: phosphoribosyltransferase, partial [Candidatus Saccharimonadales bacterium]